jgi:hypothetical protein
MQAGNVEATLHYKRKEAEFGTEELNSFEDQGRPKGTFKVGAGSIPLTS